MSTIKSSNEHLTINADGSSKDIKFQANGVEKASISSAGAFTSTTIDATKLTGTLPAISGAALTNLPSGGKVLQVKNIEYATEVNYSVTTPTVTGYTLNITPSSTSSKILFNIAFPLRKNNSTTAEGLKVLLYKNGSLHKILAWWVGYGIGSSGNAFLQYSSQLLDSPNTTSQITYAIYVRSLNGATFTLNDTNAYGSMTLMEIAG